MAELTEREKKIIHLMHSLINPQLKDVPFEIRKNMAKSNLLIRGIKFDESELTDLVQAINSETKETVKNAMALLGKYGHLFKNMDGFKL